MLGWVFASLVNVSICFKTLVTFPSRDLFPSDAVLDYDLIEGRVLLFSVSKLLCQ